MINKLCDGYQYLFYKFYAWDLLLHGKSDLPHQVAWLSLSFLVGINFFTLLEILEIFTGYGFDQIIASKIKILAIGYLFLILNYFIFVHKKKYKTIVKKFENENQKMRIIGNIFVWIFIIGSFALALFFGHLLKVFGPGKI